MIHAGLERGGFELYANRPWLLSAACYRPLKAINSINFPIQKKGSAQPKVRLLERLNTLTPTKNKYICSN